MHKHPVDEVVTSSTGIHADATQHRRPHVKPRQTPPDVKIRIVDGLNEIIKMAGVGGVSIGRYSGNTEYWRWGSQADLGGVRSMQLVAGVLGTTEEAVDAFFAPFTNELTHPRVIQASDWLKGAREIPFGRTGHLFCAADPDDDTKKIALLVEQSRPGVIEALAWYKTWIRADSQIWGASSAVETLAFERVTDDAGNPSTDPRHITPDVTWYHTVMGSSAPAA